MPYGVDVKHPTEVFGTLAITQQPSNSVTLVGTGASALNPPETPQPTIGGSYAGYQKLPGFQLERASGFGLSDSGLVASVAGTYIVSVGWGTFEHSQNSSTVAFVLAIERAGTLTFSQRPTGHRVANLGDPSNISGGGTLELEAGDVISVWLASDKSGTVTVPNANLSCHGVQV